MQASAILDRARDQLQDTGSDRWSDDTLLRYLDDGIVFLAENRPDAVYKREAVQLAQGAKQAVPDGAVKVLAVRRYMGTDGTTPGEPVTEVDAETMDRRVPGWRTARETDRPKHHVQSPGARDHYEVWPPNTGNGYVELDYSFAPDPLTDPTDTVAVDEEWRPALVDYVCYRALAEEDEFGNQGAGNHYQAFLSAIGGGNG